MVKFHIICKHLCDVVKKIILHTYCYSFINMMDIVSVYGPRDTTVLSRQATHHSESVFAGAVDRTLTVRHAGAPFWSLHGGEGALHPRVVHMLYDMGFYGVYRCGHFDMDFYLITALVERW